MADIWIVLIEDHHADVEALPFSSKSGAIAAAWDAVPEGTRSRRLNDVMRSKGWVLYLPYGTEGDFVRVVKSTMDTAR